MVHGNFKCSLAKARLLGCQKNSSGFFHLILWKNSNLLANSVLPLPSQVCPLPTQSLAFHRLPSFLVNPVYHLLSHSSSSDSNRRAPIEGLLRAMHYSKHWTECVLNSRGRLSVSRFADDKAQTQRLSSLSLVTHFLSVGLRIRAQAL